MNANKNETILPTYFISHGGGPWYWMPEMKALYQKLEKSLREMRGEIGVTPKAILVVSGHWEESDFTVMTSPNPPMVYDYSGFPEHTYSVKYNAPGSPEVASRVQELMKNAGGLLRTRTDSFRGFDHGTFVPLAAAYPEASIPVLQLSIRKDYDPGTHLAVGRALAPLRKEGVLIIGSGLSYHNLRQFGSPAAQPSAEFDSWLTETVCDSNSEARNEKLRNWSKAPSARAAHPREDHLIPLHVAAGAAEEEKGVRVYHEDSFFGGISVSSYRFGDVPKPEEYSVKG
jgi:aromatic ring-opening dioxygenase catalytic subunit (LigB family)